LIAARDLSGRIFGFPARAGRVIFSLRSNNFSERFGEVHLNGPTAFPQPLSVDPVLERKKFSLRFRFFLRISITTAVLSMWIAISVRFPEAFGTR